jgi:hypothetical protein
MPMNHQRHTPTPFSLTMAPPISNLISGGQTVVVSGGPTEALNVSNLQEPPFSLSS